MTTYPISTPFLKHAALYETEEQAGLAREAYIGMARIMYGPRVWFKRNVQKPIYCASQGGWVVPVTIYKTGRTVYVTHHV
jgi:hypothetical protein